MRQILLSTVAMAALAGPAFAADMFSGNPPPVFLAPPPFYAWSGFYVGADIGGGLGALNASSALGTFNGSGSGVVGGGRVGYGYQMDHLVIGFQGDFYGSGVSNSKYFPAVDTTIGGSQDWLASIDGRLGYAIYRVQFYAIGGVVFTQGSSTFTAGSVLGPAVAGLGFPTRVGVTHSYTGFDVGGGVEYGFNDNWIGRLEYRYYGFGGWNTPGNSWVPQTQASFNDNVVTLGLSYKFSLSEPPVVAKY